MRILVDVAASRLEAELLALLTRAGHTIERGPATAARPFDLALVGSPEAAERLKRDRPHAAVVVVTALGDVPARVRALALGADDAVDRGFPPSQIAARVDAADRRAATLPRPPERVEADGCTIDLAASTATRDGRVVTLTGRERELVRYLTRHRGRVVERAELLRQVWRVSAANATRAVDVAMVGLRAKLERDPGRPVIIVSVRGAGYRWA